MGVNPDLTPCKRDRPNVSFWIQHWSTESTYTETAFPSPNPLPRCSDGCCSCRHLQQCKRKAVNCLFACRLWAGTVYEVITRGVSLQKLCAPCRTWGIYPLLSLPPQAEHPWTSCFASLNLAPSPVKKDPNSCPRGLAAVRNRWGNAQEGPLASCLAHLKGTVESSCY